MAAAEKKSRAASKTSTTKKATGKKAPAKKAAPRKAAAKKTTAKKAAPKKAAAKKTTAKKAAPKKTAAKKSAAKKTAAKKTTAKKAAPKKTTAKKALPKKTAKKTPARKTPAKKTTTDGARSAGKRATTTTTRSTKKAKMTSSASNPTSQVELPKPRFNKDGLGYTKEFELSFIKEQYEALQAERVRLTGQAKRLEDEAHQLVEEAEMGDVQFDDEGGEGDTMVVERERDLALSAQAREAVIEIDAALARIAAGTYGFSIVSGRPIPKERLEAIPWATVLVEEKVGGIGRR
jgi:RNA polymerase-binding transcription factor DksA